MKEAENVIIDSHAWVEYFEGSPKGKKLQNLLKEQKFKFHTAECCLAEIKTWALRESRNFEEFYHIIKADSIIIPVFTNDWLDVAQERFNKRNIANFGLIDAIQIVKQKRMNAKIISGDKHFKDLANTIYIGD